MTTSTRKYSGVSVTFFQGDGEWRLTLAQNQWGENNIQFDL